MMSTHRQYPRLTPALNPASIARTLVVVRILFALVAGLGVSLVASAADAPRNILILLADDYGAMDLGADNPQTFYETPHLDRLAAQSVRFTSGYAANPVCSPTRYSILTGKYPTRSGVTSWLGALRNSRVERFADELLTTEMPLAETTLAEALEPAGYRTAFVGKWHLGQEEKFWPEAQGFDVNIGGYFRGNPGGYYSPYNNPRLADGPVGEYLTERLANETIALLEKFKAEGKPFLLTHFFYAVHTPLRAPAPLVEKYKAKAQRLGLQDAFIEERKYSDTDRPRSVRSVQSHAIYAAMVESMDTAAGRILQKLEALGLAENTLVIFTSDNGGLSIAEGAPTSNLPLRAGKGWVYEGGIRVPFLVRLPGAARAGMTSDVPVISPDIFATALDYAGVRLPADASVDGRSLAPLVRGGAPPERGALFWHYPHYSKQGGFPGGAVRIGDWKFIENYEDESVMLYNLREDVGEKNNLADAQPERVKAMRARLHVWYRETGAKFLTARPGGPQPWRPAPAGVKAPSARNYTLPDPLVSANGVKVNTAREWQGRRRAEVLELFREQVYGRSPGRPKGVTFKVIEEDPRALNGTATRREVDIAIPGPRGTFTFRLLIYLPNPAKNPVPVFLLLNHRGDVHTQVNQPFFPVDRIIARGYAAAGITLGQLSPDNANTYRDGVLRFFDGPEERSPDAWRTIAAWAWGGQRAMDYFETDKHIDAKRVAVVGHSRGGKTALWCGAQDERFALTISNNSGETGAALARRRVGQSLAIGNIRNPHWFTTNFKGYNDKEDELPVDQHELIALLAPRLAYVASAETDLWADPLGEFLSCVHATPVYRLFGLKGMETDQPPPLNQPIHDGRIGYHIRPGGHGLTEYDWQRFMDFADKHFPSR